MPPYCESGIHVALNDRHTLRMRANPVPSRRHHPATLPDANLSDLDRGHRWGSQCISVGHGGLIEFNLQPECEWESRQQELCLWIAIKDESRRFYCCRTIRVFVRSGKGTAHRRK